jgi:CheY-like chemotaxis protein
MTLKKCLLVTDDPDDHLVFSDVIADITEKAVVFNILDSQKALAFLLEKTHSPDYIFLDLSMNGIRINSFLKAMKSDADLRSIPTFLYGDRQDFNAISDSDHLIFFEKDYTYSQLKRFLSRFFVPAD